jgi:hypothetical protein
MPRGRPNKSGIDWSDPAAWRDYKRRSESHHRASREYWRREHAPHLVGAPKQPPPAGERHGSHRLTEAQVRVIRQRLIHGVTHQELAHAYGVSRATIGRIARGETWHGVLPLGDDQLEDGGQA